MATSVEYREVAGDLYGIMNGQSLNRNCYEHHAVVCVAIPKPISESVCPNFIGPKGLFRFALLVIQIS